MLTGTCLCGDCTWTFDADPGSATACNCTACRRYGVLWIYGHAGRDVHVTGPVRRYVRRDVDPAHLSFDTCETCGCLLAETGLSPDPDGRTRQAVNLRLADAPEAVMHLPVVHFDGFETFKPLPRDGRTVRDMWF